MPKKGPKNGFFYFMMDFKERQSKKGIKYANMMELQQAVDPIWKESTPSVRAKYDDIAKQEKANNNIYQGTSRGNFLSKFENHKRMVKEAADRELKFIQNYVQMNSVNDNILNEYIYIIDVSSLCQTSFGYVIGEVSLLRLNLRDGVDNHYVHEVINPPTIPIGYGSDIKIACKELALDFPDPDLPVTNYSQLLSQFLVYLNYPNSKGLPPLYTLPEKQEQVSDFLMQLSDEMNDNGEFRVYRLDTLFFYMINSLRKRSDEGLPKESLALAVLKNDIYKYIGIGCELHNTRGRSTDCTLSGVKRWAYTILESCCPLAGIEAVLGAHFPPVNDI